MDLFIHSFLMLLVTHDDDLVVVVEKVVEIDISYQILLQLLPHYYYYFYNYCYCLVFIFFAFVLFFESLLDY